MTSQTKSSLSANGASNPSSKSRSTARQIGTLTSRKAELKSRGISPVTSKEFRKRMREFFELAANGEAVCIINKGREFGLVSVPLISKEIVDNYKKVPQYIV